MLGLFLTWAFCVARLKSANHKSANHKSGNYLLGFKFKRARLWMSPVR